MLDHDWQTFRKILAGELYQEQLKYMFLWGNEPVSIILVRKLRNQIRNGFMQKATWQAAAGVCVITKIEAQAIAPEKD